jgi:type IV secretory pathway ATPase VirB11/archaellum biosynthesis ATPase
MTPWNRIETALPTEIGDVRTSVGGALDRVDRVRGSLGRTRDRVKRATNVGRASTDTCTCDPAFERRAEDRVVDEVALVIDASDCPGDGDLVDSPACRATVIDALADRDAAVVRTLAGGRERAYEDDAAALLLAAGRFVERTGFHDADLATRARRDPLRIAREATGRAGPIARIAAETGLVELAAEADGYERALRPYVGPTIAKSRVSRVPPPEARLRDTRELSTDATVRRYRVDGRLHYHLRPVETEFGADELATLAEAHRTLADGDVTGGDRAASRAVRAVASDDNPVETLTAVLRKHTQGLGVLDDLFADPRVSDVYATGPIAANPLRVTVDGQRHRTNVRLTPEGAAALSSRLRRCSGRSFSRADPTIDATLEGADTTVRVAGVTDPAGDGRGFAFRRHDSQAWTLPALVRNETLPADAAGLLSLAVARGSAVLLAGPRGAGKTTALGALLWELSPDTRTVAVEDTPELPIDALRTAGRDVQPLRTDPGEGPAPTPTAALRTALRLGEGALVLGEVRGEEAQVLYEAMRVGDGDEAVLGTIHGSGGDAVRERVVADLGVPESSFAATDLLVTLAADPHRVVRIEEVHATSQGVAFRDLYTSHDGRLVASGPLERGNSDLLSTLAAPGEQYTVVLDAVADRAEWIASLAASGRTNSAAVERARQKFIQRSTNDD